eukprot:350883-Amorphochlora_amoeboformis.AAC.1
MEVQYPRIPPNSFGPQAVGTSPRPGIGTATNAASVLNTVWISRMRALRTLLESPPLDGDDLAVDLERGERIAVGEKRLDILDQI